MCFGFVGLPLKVYSAHCRKSKLFSFAIKGWWGGGFGYGLWIGILVATGFSVIPVPSSVWKNEFKLSGIRSSKVRLLFHYSILVVMHAYMLKLKDF